jgi:hypothetical protein
MRRSPLARPWACSAPSFWPLAKSRHSEAGLRRSSLAAGHTVRRRLGHPATVAAAEARLAARTSGRASRPRARRTVRDLCSRPCRRRGTRPLGVACSEAAWCHLNVDVLMPLNASWRLRLSAQSGPDWMASLQLSRPAIGAPARTEDGRAMHPMLITCGPQTAAGGRVKRRT